MRGEIGTDETLRDCWEEQGETWVTIGTAAARVVARVRQQMRQGAATKLGETLPPPLLDTTADRNTVAETGIRGRVAR